MNKEEAIKYLQQLYPNGGHCWLDEQRIEAIDMAVNALQEEPVSENLEEAADSYIKTHGEILGFGRQTFKAGAKWQKAKDKSVTNDLGEYINELSKQFPEVSFAKLSRIAVRAAKWQLWQINEVLLSEVLPCFMHGGEADEVVAKLDEVLNQK